jgi:predicted nucleotidyltransferase
METRAEKSNRLFQVAESQQGYFTSADAKKLVYDYPHQHFHVKQGNWIRVDHGIYRLKKFPAAAHEDLMRWWLWSRKKGVISHETAAALYELGDLLPAKIHLSVPADFRKKPTKNIVLHKADLKESEIEKRDGLPVTIALRTILDLARSHLDDERLSAVTRDAIQKGLVTRNKMLEALAKIPAGIDPSTQATLQLAISEKSRNDYVTEGSGGSGLQVRETSTQFSQTRVAIQSILSELKSGLELIYRKQLRGVYFFGSYARGEADRESDLDILVVLEAFDRYAREVNRTGPLAADLSLKYGVSVSLVFLREHEWLKGDTPFLSNVREEAIPA